MNWFVAFLLCMAYIAVAGLLLYLIPLVVVPFVQGFLKGVMAHKIYKATGLRVLETESGDFMISDGGWKTGVVMTLALSEGMLENIRTDDAAAAQMGRQLRAFLLRHRQERARDS